MMCRKVLFCFLLFACASNAYNTFRNDYTFHKEADGWFKYHKVPFPFKEAFLQCNLEGAVLASPLNPHIHAVLSKYADSMSRDGMYTGVHAYFINGQFTSIEGVPLSKIVANWIPCGNRNFTDSSTCLIMMNNGTMYDVSCDESYPFVCYKKTAKLFMTECGTVDPDYKLDKRTGSCYKFHRLGATWWQAQRECLAEGGHLAVINSDTEVNVIKDVFSQNQPHTLIRVTYSTEALIGFLDWGLNGLWFTIHGQKLDDAGYSTWSAGNPNNAIQNGNGQHCGSVTRGGYLNDMWCDDKLAYICEKPVDSLVNFDEQ